MVKCVICGKEIEKSKYGNKAVCSLECLSIDFWNDVLDGTAIIIDGVCYHDGGYVEEPRRSQFLGYSGRIFKYRFLDSDEIHITNNLWCNGDIPLKRDIKDNAEFILDKEIQFV